jgi:hypothetical protein
VPRECLAALYAGNNLPAEGIFLGRGWHGLERDGEELFRWLDTDGEIILTNASTANRLLVIDVESGPSRKCEAFELSLKDEQGAHLATATVSFRHPITLELPETAIGSTILRLVVPGGGDRIAGDTRILNLRVFQMRWGTPLAPTEPRSDVSQNRL